MKTQQLKTGLFLGAITLLLSACHSVTNGPSMVTGIVSLPGATIGSVGTSVADTSVADTALTATEQAKIIASLNSQATPQTSTDIIAGEYLVQTRAGISTQSLGTLSVGGQSLTRIKGSTELGIGLYRTNGTLTQAQSAKVLGQLSALSVTANSAVVNVVPNRRVYAQAIPNDPAFPVQWDKVMLNMPAAWDKTTGKEVVVAVVDTGRTNHPDLDGQWVGGWDFISDSTVAGDGDGWDADPTDIDLDNLYHGTHVAGIIAAKANNNIGVAGVSWGAKILPVRVLGLNGGTTADIIMGTYWAAGGEVDGVPTNLNPAKVINLSLGAEGVCDSIYQTLFTNLANAGVISIVAAGNNSKDANLYIPASCDNVITVGALDTDKIRAPYSNYGSRIDLMAPGGNTKKTISYNDISYRAGVLSTIYNDLTQKYGYVFYQGTSMAAPQVAGAVALLIGEQPKLTFNQVRAMLKNASTPISCDHVGGCGAGSLDVNSLLSQPVPVVTAPVKSFSSLPIKISAIYEEGGKYIVSGSIFINPTDFDNSYTFKITDVHDDYIIEAHQDLNGNGLIDQAEPYGFYSPINKTAADIAFLGIDIKMSLHQ